MDVERRGAEAGSGGEGRRPATSRAVECDRHRRGARSAIQSQQKPRRRVLDVRASHHSPAQAPRQEHKGDGQGRVRAVQTEIRRHLLRRGRRHSPRNAPRQERSCRQYGARSRAADFQEAEVLQEEDAQRRRRYRLYQ